MEDCIIVTMFRKFSFSYHQRTMDSETMKSEKLVKLFAYLLSHHQRFIPSSELVDMLWDMDDVDNPFGALKNLIYRLRTLLKKEFHLTDLIITGKGSYAINSNYHLMIDIAEFEKYERLLKYEKKEYYEELLKCYTGKYMVEVKDDYNFFAKRVYYHSLYIDKVIEYASFLESKGLYERMEEVARDALEIDNLEEEVYKVLIRALYFQKQYKKATEIYKTTTELLYQTLGVKPSKSMLELYEMIKKENYDKNLDISQIQQELSFDESQGAFLCEYGTFREIYVTQSRMIRRLGICSYLCLITLLNRSHLDNDEQKKIMGKVMLRIQDALLVGLRIEDIVSRPNVNQFVILLPSCNYENSMSVMNRVLKKIRCSLNHTNLSIDLMFEEVLPKQVGVFK